MGALYCKGKMSAFVKSHDKMMLLLYYTYSNKWWAEHRLALAV